MVEGEDNILGADEDGTGAPGKVRDDTDGKLRLVDLHREYMSAECRRWILVVQQQGKPPPSHFPDDGKLIRWWCCR